MIKRIKKYLFRKYKQNQIMKYMIETERYYFQCQIIDNYNDNENNYVI